MSFPSAWQPWKYLLLRGNWKLLKSSERRQVHAAMIAGLSSNTPEKFSEAHILAW